jgi:hypothetical protein
MSKETFGVTHPHRSRKNLLSKHTTKGAYGEDHCQRQPAESLMTSIPSSKTAFQGGKTVGFILVSAGLLLCPARIALGSSQSPPLFLSPTTSQTKPDPGSTAVITKNLSIPSDTALVSQVISGGSLTVSNGTNSDAYVKLVEPLSRTLVGALYVNTNSTLTLNYIPDGNYQVLFVLGEGWDPNTQSFTTNKYFAKFDQSLNFTTMQLGNSIQYKAFQLTLHPVVNGNAMTSSVNEQEFNSY